MLKKLLDKTYSTGGVENKIQAATNSNSGIAGILGFEFPPPSSAQS